MTMAGNAAILTAPRLAGNRSRNSSQRDFRLTLRSMIPPGARVEAGGVVAEFDRQYMELRLDDLSASVRGRELTLETVRARLDERRKAYEQRIRVAEGAVEKARLDLRTIPVRSAIVAERFRLNLEEAQARLAQLRAELEYVDISERAAMRRQELELEEEQLDLRNGRRNSDRMVLRAPIGGIFVPQRVRRGGEYTDIRAGDDLPSGSVVGQIHDTTRLVVEAFVNQADAHVLRRGMEATLHVEAVPGLSVPARVERIGSLAQGGGARRDHVRHIPVHLDVLGEHSIMPNFTVAADIVIESSPEAILLPREAVEGAAREGHVWVRSDDAWRERPVTVAGANHVQVAIASGVGEGDVVALDPPVLAQ